MANSPERITLYNLSDLKNTTDDAIPNYLNSLKFKQSHLLGNVRLVLGYSAFILAAACFAWDYQLGFESTKHYTAAAVGLYTLLSVMLTIWTTYIETGVVYQGTAPSGEKISLASSTKKNDPTYNLTVTIKDRSSNTHKFEISKPFSLFFDASGYFVAAPFQEILATAVPVVGKRDPKRVKSEPQELLNADPELLDAVLAASGGTTATEMAANTGEKRRKA